jgi:hypothetical protein
MDILNFISWIKGGRQVTTVDASKTLIPLGLKDNRRDDGYLAGAITVEDFAAQLTPPAPEPAYKVYTALLTQSGGDNEIEVTFGMTLEIGVTYYILSNGGDFDLTIFGAPNSQVGTYFVCTTEGTCPDGVFFTYNTGAPVVTVLENTIGNIWFTYEANGRYYIYSDALFTINKTTIFLGQVGDDGDPTNPGFSSVVLANSNLIFINTFDGSNILENNGLISTPIEIRVYN